MRSSIQRSIAFRISAPMPPPLNANSLARSWRSSHVAPEAEEPHRPETLFRVPLDQRIILRHIAPVGNEREQSQCQSASDAWTTSKGVEKEAWVVDYVDQAGKRRLKTFAKKKAADNFAATANVEIRAGVHTADSASITVAEAGKLWIETGEQGRALERSTLDAYRQHLSCTSSPISAT